MNKSEKTQSTQVSLNYCLHHSFSEAIERPKTCLYDKDGKPIPNTSNLRESAELAYLLISEIYEGIEDKPGMENHVVSLKLSFIEDCWRAILSKSAKFEFQDEDGTAISTEEFKNAITLGTIETKIRTTYMFLEHKGDIEESLVPKTSLAVAGFLAALHTVIERLKSSKLKKIERDIYDDLLFWLPKVAVGYAKESSRRATVKQSKQKAATARHAEAETCREIIISEWEKRKSEFRSTAEAARKLDKLVPYTQETIKRWISDYKKENK